MKKILVIIFVLIASYGYAQDLKFGVKAGLNLANVAGDDVDNNKVNTRFYFGGFLNTPLSDAVSFQPELLVSMQGFEVDMDLYWEIRTASKVNKICQAQGWNQSINKMLNRFNTAL